MGKATPSDNTRNSRSSKKKEQFTVGDPAVHRGHSGLLIDNMRKIKSESIHKILPIIESCADEVSINIHDGQVIMPITDSIKMILESLMERGIWLAYNDVDSDNVYFDAWVDHSVLNEDLGSDAEKQVGVELARVRDEMINDDEMMYLLRAIRKALVTDASSDTPLTIGKLDKALQMAERMVLPHRDPSAPTRPGQGLGSRGGMQSGPRGG